MTRTRRSDRTRVGRLFGRANAWQKAVAVLCVLVAVHGVYTLFVPGVDLPDSDLPCPPAVAAALAGSGGVSLGDVSAEVAARHDAACAATGRWYVVAALLQIGVAVVWGLATLEWARVARRMRRRRDRRRHNAGASDRSTDTGPGPDEAADGPEREADRNGHAAGGDAPP